MVAERRMSGNRFLALSARRIANRRRRGPVRRLLLLRAPGIAMRRLLLVQLVLIRRLLVREQTVEHFIRQTVSLALDAAGRNQDSNADGLRERESGKIIFTREREVAEFVMAIAELTQSA
jgi:hypothetical protein